VNCNGEAICKKCILQIQISRLRFIILISSFLSATG